MIILDDQDQIPKIPDPIYAPPVNRCSTPTSTSSLPDYDTSEAQQKQKPSWLRKPEGRYWKIVVIILIVYCLLTVVIGVPLIVVKLRHSQPSPLYTSTPWNPQQASVIVIPEQEIINSPPTFNQAADCNQWTSLDEENNGLLTSTATYNMPMDIGIFLGSNGSYRADAKSKSISGSLHVDVNDDSSVIDIQIGVTMSYSSTDVRNRTNVCLVDAFDNNGFYIYVPDSLTEHDLLSFDITMLFPQTQDLNVSSFAVMLPLFDQHYAALSPRITFSQVVLGGPMSNVTVDSVTADNLFVMSSPGSIKGTFGASEQLVLETMSAEIDANITMQVKGDVSQPSIRMNTGNKVLSANITLQVPSPNWSGKWSRPPQVLIDANTFNAPLILSVTQAPPPPLSYSPLPVFVHAGNNLGITSVFMDSNYEGTFLAQTEYATATVQDDDGGNTSNLTSTYSYTPRSGVDEYGRTLYYDSVTDSSVSGWVGRGQRPKVISTAGSPGCVEVITVLSSVLLNLAS